MLTIRAIVEASLILVLIGLFTFTLVEWENLGCAVPFNIWLIVFCLLNLSTRSLFLVVSVIPNNFTAIRLAAYGFFFIMNPLIILCTITGLVFYIIVCADGFFCGPLVTTWTIVVSLSAGVTYSVMAVMQSCRIYRALSFLRSIVVNGGLNERFATTINGTDNLTLEDLERLPAYSAGETVIGNECVICHEWISLGEIVRELPVCNHLFHKECIDNWLVQSPTCPLCRNNIRVSIL